MLLITGGTAGAPVGVSLVCFVAIGTTAHEGGGGCGVSSILLSPCCKASSRLVEPLSTGLTALFADAAPADAFSGDNATMTWLVTRATAAGTPEIHKLAVSCCNGGSRTAGEAIVIGLAGGTAVRLGITAMPLGNAKL